MCSLYRTMCALSFLLMTPKLPATRVPTPIPTSASKQTLCSWMTWPRAVEPARSSGSLHIFVTTHCIRRCLCMRETKRLVPNQRTYSAPLLEAAVSHSPLTAAGIPARVDGSLCALNCRVMYMCFWHQPVEENDSVAPEGHNLKPSRNVLLVIVRSGVHYYALATVTVTQHNYWYDIETAKPLKSFDSGASAARPRHQTKYFPLVRQFDET